MLVYLIKKSKIINLYLPEKTQGNYWVSDCDKYGIERNLINIEDRDNKWLIKSNFEVQLLNSKGKIDETFLSNYAFNFIKVNSSNEILMIYSMPSNDPTFNKYVTPLSEITIGSNQSNKIVFNNGLISANHAIIRKNNEYEIEDLNSQYGTYVNNERVIKKRKLYYGDIVFIMGLKIIIMKDFLIINNPNNSVKISNEINVYNSPQETIIEHIQNDEEEIQLYNEDDYFLRSPRFVASDEKDKVIIDPPPAPENQKEKPLIYTLGPMLTMGMTSAVTGVMAVNNVVNNNLPITQALPSLIICCAMLFTMILWPSLTRRYEKKQRIEREKIRQEKYVQYLKKKEEKIEFIKKSQAQVLAENNLTIRDCNSIIMMKKRNLWERKIEDIDFLNFRLGIGNCPLNIEINYPEEHFTIDEDKMRDSLDDLIRNAKDIKDVPVSISLTERKNIAVLGTPILQKRFITNMIMQLVTFQSHEDLKLVFLLNDHSDIWEIFKDFPHTWSLEKDIRFFATNMDEMTKLSFYLDSVFHSRQSKGDNKDDYKQFSPYYVIITNDIKKARTLDLINNVLNEKKNLGISIIVLNEGLSYLPNEITNYILLDERESAVIESDLTVGKQQKFYLDASDGLNIRDCCLKLASIPIKYSNKNLTITNNLGFLEMYNVGKVEHLNSFNRWINSNPMYSLSVPIGVYSNGELFNLDLHEKFHGPHGLIAGMTGSGKSELIITFILSMAVNYSPEEVNFVLIDYKGGGLAGAFSNSDLRFKLPHLVGTITNLDTAEIKRALMSIQSELRRRQYLFNQARDKVNESTIDIYKYQKLYRERLVDEPISHLFIICDEFAELKTQKPEFMEQLISTARIGRSLGVHLILATQKPSGIVDDQIWSNSKFKICLKVQEKSDSMDVIKTPDAVELKNAGRFYLQVGYNDLFALGQSAWCGRQYYPVEKYKRKLDKSVAFIDSIGNVIRSVDTGEKFGTISYGEELPNIIKYLSDLATREKFSINKLWLDIIPPVIYVDDLKHKYNYKKEKFLLNPIIGELDDPSNQRQDILTLPLGEYGNTLIYGSPGSGKENLLTTILCSSIVDYSSEEINFYVLDFGSEMLRVFKNAPQVGDVIFANDKEKITNMFKVLNSELEIRKKEFIKYNGDYKLYCKNSGKTMPMITVIINNFEPFMEMYEDFYDNLVSLSRDGQRYGIVFIIAVNGTTSIRYRLSQNFKQNLVLQMTDTVDYTTILGNPQGTYPSNYKGRGIVKLDGIVYEFQTALPYQWDNLTQYLKIICEKIGRFEKTGASEIAVLPNVISNDIVEKYNVNLSSVPIGVSKQDLNVISYNFKNKYATIITSEDISNSSAFISSLLTLLTSKNYANVVLLDAMNNIGNGNLYNCLYYNSDFDSAWLKIKNFVINKQSNVHDSTVIIFNGLEAFFNSLNSDNKKEFDSIIVAGSSNVNFNIIIVDGVESLKRVEYDTWFRSTINTNYGIWIGNGISNQFLLKFNNFSKTYKEKMSSDFGYVINNGEPTLVKLINFSKNKGSE